ncbi:MAG: DUF4157 domain-containing protein [Phormidesmis sp. CAN_BIN44]|nr:DUF4157 domain-containing protein [Phormidesmis sp. CAN_BIN44]
MPLLQRKPSCACGGGCPRCQESALLQTKLKISEPGDRYEQEADRVADEVMRMPEPTSQRQMEPEEVEEERMIQRKAIANQITPLVQRQVLPEMEEEEEEVIQTKTIDNQVSPSTPTRESSEAPPSVHKVLSSPGQPLDPVIRAFMEPRFDHDFSRVRIYSGGAAEQSAREVNANAYTAGHNIVFGAGEFAPGTQEGRRLIAHELTHVVQQSGAEGIRVGQSNEKRGTSPISPELTHVLQQNRHTVASEAVVQRKPKPSDSKAAKPAKAPKISKGPASSTPGLDLMPSVKGAPCACLVVIHNDERGARMTARLLHDQCSYNLALVHPDTKKREIDIPNVGMKDPNGLFPESIVDECMTDEQACRDFLKDKASSTDPKETLRFAQTQYFLTIKECSNSFTLPVVGLHNNDTADTAAYLKDITTKKINVDDLKGDLDKTDPKDGEKQLKKLRQDLDAKVKGAGNLLDTESKTSIFRWCNLPDIGKCHVGDPQHPDNVIWVTNEEDFKKLSTAGANVVLQTAIGKESETDLSTAFLFLKRLSEVQEIQEIFEDFFWPDFFDDLFGTGSSSATIDATRLHFINIEGAGKGYDPKTERIRNYEAIVTALKATRLYCCGDDPTAADKNIKDSLAMKEAEVDTELKGRFVQGLLDLLRIVFFGWQP